jgi:PKD repeat protein
VIDIDGGVATTTVAVTILNANPIANGGTDRVVSEAVPINLVGAATDPGTADILTYEWDFNYNGNNFDSEATGQSVSATYPDGPATYVVALRVRDDDYPFPTSGGGEIGEALDTLTVTVNNTPPLAEAGGPYSGVERQPVTLSGSAVDAAADTLTYEWDLNNDGTFETPGRTVVNTWPVGGLYTVALRVTDDDGGIGTDTASVDINFIPLAVAGGPYGGNEGTLITFNGSGSSDPDRDPLTYTWNFGDGSPPANGVNPSHTYADNGVYNVSLQVNDGLGGIAIATTTATINNLPPTANAGLDRTGVEGQNVNFNGTATDPGTADTFTFQWDFNYDGVTFTVDATGQNVTNIFPDGPASVTVALRVIDDDGGVSPDDPVAVTVNNVSPTANAGGPYATTAGVAITLTGSGSDVPADTLTYAWDLDNDGNFETPGQTVVFAWTTPGNRTVALRVQDDDGAVTVSTTTVNVGSPPTADAGGPYTGDEGSPITLTGNGSDPDGDPLTYAWDLDNNGDFETSGRVVTNIWPDDGNFTVNLRVTDGRGGVATDTAIVTVNNVAPTADAGPDRTVNVNEQVAFNGSASDPGQDPLTFEWDFDYGGSFSADASGPVVANTWTTSGTYTIMLQVDDGDGGVGTDTVTVLVNGVLPLVWLPRAYALWRRRRQGKR